jgi:hypothetical protein
MGQTNSLEDQHLDGSVARACGPWIDFDPTRCATASSHTDLALVVSVPPSPSATSSHTFPPHVAPGSSAAGSDVRVPAPVSVVPVGGGGPSPTGPPRREDSGNDFAMSIADGAPHGGGARESGGGTTPAPHPDHLASPPPTQPKIETVPTAFKCESTRRAGARDRGRLALQSRGSAGACMLNSLPFVSVLVRRGARRQ